MSITTLTCPTDCEPSLPVVAFNDCDPEIKLSQGKKLYIALPTAAAFAAADDIAEWADRLSQTAALPNELNVSVTVEDLIRTITIIGDIPAPSVSTKDISGGRKYNTKTERVINIEIDEASPENYEFARTTECGVFKCKAWYETEGGMLYGGNSGIEGVLYLTPVLGRGTDEVEKYTGTFKWNDKTSPDRCVSPLA